MLLLVGQALVSDDAPERIRVAVRAADARARHCDEQRREDGAATDPEVGHGATLRTPAAAGFMNKQVSAEDLTRTDGVLLVLFSTRWRLEGFQRDNPDVKLGSLVAAEG